MIHDPVWQSEEVREEPTISIITYGALCSALLGGKAG